ncbi:MAG TPA: hypothetical protein VFW87_19190 [Pirellulales bacterium]|nr:hypothetical protein [Pirellulales bacterium]
MIGAYLTALRYDPRSLAVAYLVFALFSMFASAKVGNMASGGWCAEAMSYSFALAITVAAAFGIDLLIAATEPAVHNWDELAEAFVEVFAKVLWFELVFGGCVVTGLACLARSRWRARRVGRAKRASPLGGVE